MALSSTLLAITLAPLILTCSLVLLPFAILTTTLALSMLFIRVLAVYFELFIAIVHNHLSTLRAQPTLSPASSRRSKSVRSLSTSSRGSGSQTPRLHAHAPSIYAANTPLIRDFEGVGGWRIASEDTDAEDEWVTMNARLELPAVGAIPEERKRRHQRSLTQGSLVDKIGLRRARAWNRPRSAVITATASPEDRLRADGRAKSAVMLGETGMNVGRSRGESRRKSESSESSGGSGKTLTMYAPSGR